MEYKEILRKEETITNIIVNMLVEIPFYKGIIDENKIKLGIENRYISEKAELEIK